MSAESHPDRHIGGEDATRRVGGAIATLATRQSGVVGREQLRQLGLGDDAIDARIEARRLHVVHRGVYAVRHRRLSREGRYLAAVLACGDGAVLSHRAAAVLWELRAPKEGKIDVIAMTHRIGDTGIRVHRHGIDRGEITTRQGIPVTTPIRTILDLASCVTPRELERAIRQAVYRRLTSTRLLAEAVERCKGRRGVRALREALINLGEAPGLTRSELEQLFLRFLRKHSLPLPELNESIQGLEVDCVWRKQKLIVELDGRDAHDSTPAFESDRARDSALQTAGWRVVRVTSRRMRADAASLAAELRQLLAATK